MIALAFGFFCVRLTKIYFAMLTLAFAQIVWAICFKWNDVTGGEQGLSNVPYPDLGWMAAIPGLGRMRVGEHYFYVTLVLVAVCFSDPAPDHGVAVRADTDDDPGKSGARRVHRHSCAPL